MAYTGEIQLFAFGYAPPDWHLCDGSAVNISSFSALYALIGTTYGGDGTRTFRLPNLCGRAACGSGTGSGLTERKPGDTFGEAQVALTADTAPPHTHGLGFYALASGSSGVNQPAEGYSLTNAGVALFVNTTAEVSMQKNLADTQGSATAHENRQPYLALNHYILTRGDPPAF